MVNTIRRHYRILICVAGLLIHFCNCGLVTTSFSIFLPLIREGINLSNSDISGLMTLRNVVSLMATMLAVRYYRAMSLRRGITIASLLVPLGFLIFSQADSLWMCCLAVIILGFAYGIGAVVAISFLMRNWFQDHFSTAMSVCTIGSGIATVSVPLFVAYLSEMYGLKAAFMGTSILAFVCVVLVFLIVRDRPEDIGMKAECMTAGAETAEKKMTGQTLSRGKWILIMMVSFLVGAAGTPSTTNMSIHFVTSGYTATEAARALSLFGMVLIIGKIIYGITNDRFGSRRMNFVFIGFFILACAMFQLADGDSPLRLYLPSGLYGLGGCVGALGISYWTADFARPEDFRKRLQRNQTMFSVGSLIVTPFPGILADLTGSYNVSYLACMLMGIAMLCIIQYVYFSEAYRPAQDKCLRRETSHS